MAINENKLIEMNTNYFATDSLQMILKYILIFANCVIILDAIFLLISEKDSYQGEFIEGRHQVSRYLLLMLYVDIQSVLMILIAVFGIIGVQKANLGIVLTYGLIIAIVAILSINDLDAFVMEVFILFCTGFYGMAIKQSSNQLSYDKLKDSYIQNIWIYFFSIYYLSYNL